MMELVFQNDVAPTFGVDFHGVKLIVPRKYLYGWLVMDPNMVVSACMTEPYPCRVGPGEGYTYWCTDDKMSIATVETDMDWKDTLISIDSPKVTKYLR